MQGAYHLMILFFIAHIFLSFSGSPPTGRTGAPGESTCTSCHNVGNSQGLDGSISISGLPAEVLPSTNYRVTVEVANPNGLSLTAGMSMVALDSDDLNAGSFSNPSPGANVEVTNFNGRNYLGHNPAQAYDANRISSWSVDWTSPADPDPNVTFYAVGNITDGDVGANTSNDLIVFNTQSTEVAEPVVMEFPDLTASNVVGFDGTFEPDDVVEFNWDLNNLGTTVAVNAYRVVMYLSSDQTFSADDPEVGEVPTGNTFPGTIPNVPGAIRVPLGTADGDYYLHIVVDNDNTVEESDETNNVLTTNSTISVGTIVMPDPLEATVTEFLECEGVGFTVQATGGTAPYTYSWSTGETTSTIVATVDALYSVTVTDAMGQFVSINNLEVINEHILMLDIETIAQPNCESGGTLELSILGGTPPFDILWSNGFTGTLNTGLIAGSYSVEVIDANNCASFTGITIENTDEALDIDAEVTQISCFGGVSNASISLTESDDYTYNWSTGETSATITNLAPGSYSVTVNSSAGCEFMGTYIITEVNPIELVSTVEDVSCNGGSDGAINVLAIGGTGPYTYAWSTGQMTNNISNLSSGDYILSVTDANGCELISDFTIAEPAQLSLTLEGSTLDCFGDSDGSVEILEINGGVTPYSFNSTQGGLTAGVYTVTVTDANGCTVVESAEVVEPEEIIIQGEVGFSTDGGSIDINVTGGTGTYTYIWTTGESTEDIFDLTPGTYMVVVTDDNGCIASQEFEIINTSVPAISELRSWEIYPTVVNDNLNVSVSLDDTVFLQIQIVGLDGTYIEVPASDFTQTSLEQKTIVDVSSLSSGMYMLILDSENGREVKRFIKQ